MKLSHRILWVAALVAGCGGGSAEHRTAQTSLITFNPAPAASTAARPASTASPAVPVPALANLQAPDTLDRSSSLAGPDTNNDGVRDDINRWVDAQSYSAPEKKAIHQFARTVQQTLLVNAKDKQEARRAAEAMFIAIHCARMAFEPGSRKPSQSVKHLEAITANTKERAMQYILFSGALDGMTFEMPTELKCD